MEEVSKKRQIPAFGQWDYCDDLPITQYFESAMQAGLVRPHYKGDDEDLFKVSAAVLEPVYHSKLHHGKARNVRGEKKVQSRKKGSKCEITAQQKPNRARMAVDEDLYKIPPELLSKTIKRVGLLPLIDVMITAMLISSQIRLFTFSFCLLSMTFCGL